MESNFPIKRKPLNEEQHVDKNNKEKEKQQCKTFQLQYFHLHTKQNIIIIKWIF